MHHVRQLEEPHVGPSALILVEVDEARRALEHQRRLEDVLSLLPRLLLDELFKFKEFVQAPLAVVADIIEVKDLRLVNGEALANDLLLELRGLVV